MNVEYIEARFPRYFIFGTHRDGRVDIGTKDDSTVATMSIEHAEKIIANHNLLVDKLIKLAGKFDDLDPAESEWFWLG